LPLLTGPDFRATARILKKYPDETHLLVFQLAQLPSICAIGRVIDYINNMGILQTIAGIIIALYTFSSVVGLWLAYQMMDSAEAGKDVPEALSEIPVHHIELMANYAQGWRRHAWSASIVALFTTLIAMVANSPLAFWALGVAILIDLGLFMTYEDLKGFLAQTDLQERLIDAVQSLALLFALTLLLWIQMRQGQILQ
jgi:hypothetical protein